MAWLQLTLRSNGSRVYVNTELVYQVGTFNSHARLMVVSTSGADGGSHSPKNIDVRESTELVIQMLERAGAEIIRPPSQA